MTSQLDFFATAVPPATAQAAKRRGLQRAGKGGRSRMTKPLPVIWKQRASWREMCSALHLYPTLPASIGWPIRRGSTTPETQLLRDAFGFDIVPIPNGRGIEILFDF
jgi:hypothetical protein